MKNEKAERKVLIRQIRDPKYRIASKSANEQPEIMEVNSQGVYLDQFGNEMYDGQG